MLWALFSNGPLKPPNKHWNAGRKYCGLVIFTHWTMWSVSLSPVTSSDRYCHSVKWLHCRDLVFCSAAHRRVQAETGLTDLLSFACRTHPWLLDVDVEHWLCDVPQLQGPEWPSYPTRKHSHTHTDVCMRSHTDTHTHSKGASVIRCPVPCLHFGAADETCCVRDTLRTLGCASGGSSFITFWSTGKGLNLCCRTTTLTLLLRWFSSFFVCIISQRAPTRESWMISCLYS